jgi:hypothetical protein
MKKLTEEQKEWVRRLVRYALLHRREADGRRLRRDDWGQGFYEGLNCAYLWAVRDTVDGWRYRDL